MSAASELLALLERIVDERVDARLAARGAVDRAYSSRGPLPSKTSRRTFNLQARAMLAAGVEGVRREGQGMRDRVYFVEASAWHTWRTTARAEKRAPAIGDDELAAAALVGAGLRVVHGGRR